MRLKKGQRAHVWEGDPISHARCTVCGEYVECPADPCDSDKINKWINSLKRRKDCPGKPRVRHRKIKYVKSFINPSNGFWP